jgi:CheY-like chemotaxis protein
MQNSVIGVFVDDKIERTLYERAFERLEHRVQGYVFSNPEEGISFSRELSFDIVFIELHFWGENYGGISILEQLRKTSDRNIIAIAITPLLQGGDLEHVTAAGFTMCMEKPLSFDTLKILCTPQSAS